MLADVDGCSRSSVQIRCQNKHLVGLDCVPLQSAPKKSLLLAPPHLDASADRSSAFDSFVAGGLRTLVKCLGEYTDGFFICSFDNQNRTRDEKDWKFARSKTEEMTDTGRWNPEFEIHKRCRVSPSRYGAYQAA